MLKLIEDFPNHIIEGIEIANQTNFTNAKNDIRNVVLCGMGGSGIGANIVSDWVRSEANVPVTLVADYFLPEFVSENTLVIASSYSGNTEETMQALETADSKQANIVCICSGGKMEVFCSENNNFINYDKKDSVGICFVGERNLKDFLKRFIKFESGDIKDSDGNIVGTHPGALLFTQGQ